MSTIRLPKYNFTIVAVILLVVIVTFSFLNMSSYASNDFPITWSSNSFSGESKPYAQLSINFTSNYSINNVTVTVSNEIKNLAYFASKTFDIQGRSEQNLLLTLLIPPTTNCGWHNGTITLSANGQGISKPFSLDLLIPPMFVETTPTGYGNMSTVTSESYSPFFNNTIDIQRWVTLPNGTSIPIGSPFYDVFLNSSKTQSSFILKCTDGKSSAQVTYSNGTISNILSDKTTTNYYYGTNGKLLLPRQQISNGINPARVTCDNGLVLIMKSSLNSIACVTPEAKQKLVERGWASAQMYTVIPKLTDDDAIQIVRSDLARHLPNLDKIIIGGRDPIPNIPDYPKHPLRLIDVFRDGTQQLINNMDFSSKAICVPPNPSCSIHDNAALQASSEKVVYLVDLVWYTKTGTSGPTYYLVDAFNGDILYSTLLENIMGSNKTMNEYRP